MDATIRQTTPELPPQHGVGGAEDEVDQFRRRVDDPQPAHIVGHGLLEERLIDLEHHLQAGIGTGGAGETVPNARVEAIQVAGLVAQAHVVALELVEQLVERLGYRVPVGETALGEQGVEDRHRHDVLGRHRDEILPIDPLADRGAHRLQEPLERLREPALDTERGADAGGDPVGDRGDLLAPASPILTIPAHLHDLGSDDVLEGKTPLNRVTDPQVRVAVGAAVASRPVASIAELPPDDDHRWPAAQIGRVDGHVEAFVVGAERLQHVPYLLEVRTRQHRVIRQGAP